MALPGEDSPSFLRELLYTMKRFAVPLVGLLVLAVFAGGYFAFDGQGGKPTAANDSSSAMTQESRAASDDDAASNDDAADDDAANTTNAAGTAAAVPSSRSTVTSSRSTVTVEPIETPTTVSAAIATNLEVTRASEVAALADGSVIPGAAREADVRDATNAGAMNANADDGAMNANADDGALGAGARNSDGSDADVTESDEIEMEAVEVSKSKTRRAAKRSKSAKKSAKRAKTAKRVAVAERERIEPTKDSKKDKTKQDKKSKSDNKSGTNGTNGTKTAAAEKSAASEGALPAHVANKTASASGKLSVTSNVPAMIYIDGRSTQMMTPKKFSVPAGPHKVTLLEPGSKKAKTQDVEIIAGKVTSVEKQF